jgi:ribonucleoside-diphosphate reductase alpha chain
LHITHPDVYDFIESKNDLSVLQNFNLSVAITDEFMEAVIEDKDFNLINPRNNAVAKVVRAKELFKAIAYQAWKTGDPGVVFIDEMNRKYPFSQSSVLCTGSCGQYELESFEGVPYAHINLSSLVIDDKMDLDKLRHLVRVAVHFLDNCIDMHSYTHDVVERKTKQSRKIGLGLIGFADLLFALKIPYGSQDSLDLIRKFMSVIQEESRSASHQLALQRGSFPTHDKSTWKQPMRHATITSIAPTGSTSLIAGTSQSIEPVYAFSFTSKTSEGVEFTILNKFFKNAVDALAIDRVAKIQLQFVDSIQNISWLDDSFKKIFKTAMDISPLQHLNVMATFQEYVDNSISKTINLPNHASVKEVEQILLSAFELKCKGVTLYRDGCRSDQALNTKTQTRLSAFEDEKL